MQISLCMFQLWKYARTYDTPSNMRWIDINRYHKRSIYDMVTKTKKNGNKWKKIKIEEEKNKEHAGCFWHTGFLRITADLYCNRVHLYWEGCVICTIYFRLYLKRTVCMRQKNIINITDIPGARARISHKREEILHVQEPI